MSADINTGSIIHVPLHQIRPFANQPRTDFDPKALQELADALSEVGQQLSALVIKLPPDGEHLFELVDGERRWRACKIAGIETLKCEVVETADEAEQYRRSVASNFGKADHTPLEITNAIRTLRNDGMTIESIAKLFGKSVPWVCNYQRLQGLSEPVMRLLTHPDKEKRLNVSQAFAICQLPEDQQLPIAKECIGSQMKVYQINQRVRTKKVELGIISAEDRDTHDDWKVLYRFFNRTKGDLKPLMDLDEDWILKIFNGRNDDQLMKLDNLSDDVAGELMAYAEFLQRLIHKVRLQRQRKASA